MLVGLPRLLLCSGLLFAACGDDDPSGPDAGDTTHWSMLHQGDPGALLGVWGTSASDVWVVGARPSLDAGPTILHYDGASWTRVDSNQSSLDLWWVTGFPGGDVFFGGSSGTILRYRAGSFEKMITPRMSGTIFGIWGASPNDLWAVGAGGSAGAIIWRFDGQTWSELAPPSGVPSNVFKVDGRAANDVWMSAANGVTLHWDGASLTVVPSGSDVSLFSVVTTPTLAFAVGGQSGQGVLLENAGAGWQMASLAGVEAFWAWRGVATNGSGTTYVVGELGSVALRGASSWTYAKQTLTQRNFHAAWVDPDDGLWAVGGDFDRVDPTAGFIVYYGSQAISEVMP